MKNAVKFCKGNSQTKVLPVETVAVQILNIVDESSIDNAVDTMKVSYNALKNEYECNDSTLWCKFGEPDIQVSELPNSQDKGISIMWEILGRSFYIKRHFKNDRPEVKRHSHRSNVPKKKRGKPIL